jgi:hypothetical protein
MNNMIPLQYASAENATAQPNHGSTALSMTILGPVHASNLCHNIHHEVKDMSINEIENHEQKYQPGTSCTKMCAHHAQHPCT